MDCIFLWAAVNKTGVNIHLKFVCRYVLISLEFIPGVGFLDEKFNISRNY